MIIGLATLITILFFGGVSETFLVDKLEKGVKNHIISKERRKEITADINASKKYIKAFNKQRKGQLKAFTELNANRDASREEMETFFNQLKKERKEFQKTVIANRIEIAKKIEPDEWTLILATSEESVEKRKAKQQKKIDKGKTSVPFEKTNSLINEKITDHQRKENLLAALQKFIDDQSAAVEKLNSMNVVDNEIVSDKNAGEQQLMEIGNKLNELRQQAFRDMVDFHFSVKENTSEEEWGAIIKSFNKEMAITIH